ncbi:MAG: efflux transporter outer membrane subunit [Comamonadaceae bacterium]|nr:MAG: efflux transporter outer membrane subunit [Comamonadaceae bacterium]
MTERLRANASRPLRTMLTGVAAAALLAGCSLIPSYERPDAPVPATFPGNPALQPGALPAAALSWQDYFADARLQQLIGIALRNNRDLRLAAINIEQARATYQIQRAAVFPTVGLNVAGTRQRPSLLGEGVSQSVQAGIGVSAWEIDLFGRIGSLREAALAQFLATEEARKAVQISLIANVANGWLTLLADDELLELTRQTLQARQEGLRLTRLRFDSGVSSEIDFQLANGLAETARATYAQQQRQRLLDENALALLLGQPVPPGLLPVVAQTPVPPRTAGGSAPGGAAPSASPVPTLDTAPGGLASLTPMPDLPAGLPSDLLTQRPDIRQAEQQLLAANANIGAARAAFFPRIALTATFGSASNELSGLFGSGTQAWSFAPQVTLPIFDAGRNQAGLDAALAQRQSAVAQYERSIQSAFREVADALAGQATLGEQLRATRAQAESEAVRFRLSDLRFRNGIASALDLLDAQRSLFAAQQAAVQTRLQLLQNQVTLYKSLGGGWKEDAPMAAATGPATGRPL